jgi:hypothetical protein
MELRYWRIEEGHFACYDVYVDGHYVSTYECDLYANMGSYSWAQQVAGKNWAFDDLIFELSQIETAFAPYSYQNPLAA